MSIKKIILLAIIWWTFSPTLSAQDRDMELLQTKLELMDARLKLLDQQLKSMENRPLEFAKEIDALDLYFQQQRDSIMLVLKQAGYLANLATAMEKVEFKSNLYLDPYRLFEGSILLGYERALNPSLSLDLAFIGTYLTKGGGLGGGYFSQQDLEAYNEVSQSYEPVEGDMITGWGMVLKAKKYLLARMNPSSRAPLGLYAAPQMMYRNIKISGLTYPYLVNSFVETEVTQHLNVFAGGVILGGKFPLMKVFAVDVYIGGMMRMSQYKKEKGFTKYKSWNNIDYSGVLPTAGISIGILQ